MGATREIVLDEVRIQLRDLLDDQHCPNSEHIIAERILPALSKTYIWFLAREWLMAEIWRMKRADQRQVQNAAAGAVSDWEAETEKREQSKERRRENAAERREAKKAGYDDVVEYQLAKLAPQMNYINSALRLVEDLLETEFALGDGRRVTWREATIEEHTERVEYMRKKVSGYGRDIKLHEMAVGILQSYGARCLGDLPYEGAELINAELHEEDS